MQIQTIEDKTGLDRATIRYYEKEGLIHPQRLQNGYRDYSQAQLNDLMKIKLLRQLGLSLEVIQNLIEGKEDLQSVVQNQLVILNTHKDHIDTAELICKMIIQENVTYKTIEPHKYISAINKNQSINNKVIDTPQTQYVYMESHPFRRFIGRYLDHILIYSILMLIVIVLMRVRPFGDIQIKILSVAALFLVMPVNALFLSLLGTTPGKFAFGIYLKTPDGRNMPFFCALRREWGVFRHGCGFYIPIYSWIRLFKSYKIHTKGQELEWDYDADVNYTPWGIGKWVYSIILCLLCFFAVFYSTIDAQYPKHRNVDLTICQFSENFNDYAKQIDRMFRLTEEGEWYSSDSTPVMIIDDISGTAESLNNEEYWNFVTDKNQKIMKIQMSTNARIFFNEKLYLVLYTAIMSQPDADINVASNALRQFSEPILITEFGGSHYNFNGVIVNIEPQILQQNKEDAQAKTLIEILFP